MTLKNLAEGYFTLSRAGVHTEDRLLPRGVDLSEGVEDFLKHEGGRNIA